MWIFLCTVFLLVHTINASLGNYTGTPPWYWKPTRPRAAVSEETLDNISNDSINEFVRSTREIHWLEEIEKRKNQSGYMPPMSPNESVDNECPKDVIHDNFDGKGYFFSWEDRRTDKLRMPWVQAVNFCRARCLELVSIETPREHAFLAKHITAHRIRGAWTSGRKCDFHGCEERPELQPADIYGWYWEGSRIVLPPTTDRFDVLWSNSGSQGKPQPDDSEGKKGGERESCLSILNNAYHDGVAWHDEICSKRKPFICEERSTYHRPEVRKPASHNFEYYTMNQ